MENKVKSKIGQWTPYRILNADEKILLHNCTDDLLGVKYMPMTISTQLVNGMNYRYKCEATPIYPGAESYKVIIQIYAPMEGEPHISEITPI